MNTSYRSTWNESLGAWVAVSEVQSTRGKASRAGTRCAVALLALALASGVDIKPVWAACPADTAGGMAVGAGDACSANQPSYTGSLSAVGGGAELTISAIKPTVTTSSTPGLKASSGGWIKVDAGLNVSTTNDKGIWAEANSRIDIKGDVNATISGTTQRTKAIAAEGAGAVVNVDGALYVKSGDAKDSNAIAAENGGVVYINNGATIETGTTGGLGHWISSIYANSNSEVRLKGLIKITHFGGAEEGAAGLTSQEGLISFSDDLDLTTSGAPGLYSTGSGGTIEGKRAKIRLGGTPLASNPAPPAGQSSPMSPYALLAIDGGRITLASLDVMTSAADSYAVLARRGGVVNIDGSDGLRSSVVTSGAESHAIYADGAGAAIEITNADIETLGIAAQGIRAVSAGSVIAIGARIVTTGAPVLRDATQPEDALIPLGGVNMANDIRWANGISAQDDGTLVSLKQSSIATSGYRTLGVNASSGSRVELDDLQVTTSGKGATGVWATGTSSTGVQTTITLNQGRISTTGENAVGLGMDQGARIDVSNSTISTTGNGGNGIWFTGVGSLLNLHASTVNVSGNWVTGMTSDGGALAQLTGLNKVLTSGVDGVAWRAQNAGRITGSGKIELQTNTVSGVGVMADSGGIVDFDGEVQVSQSLHAVHVQGAGSQVRLGNTSSASAIEVAGTAVKMGSGSSLKVGLQGMARVASADPVASVFEVLDATGSSTLTLTQSVATAGAAERLLHLERSSGFVFQNNGSTLTGNIDADSSAMEIRLTGGSMLTGTVQATKAAVNVNGTSDTWSLTGNSAAQSVDNGGVIRMSPSIAARASRTLQVDEYVGNNGSLHVQTHLDVSGSNSDRLVINPGGRAIGNSTVYVTNTSYTLGAPTSTTGDGKGIQVVQALSGAVTNQSSFVLPNGNAPIHAGAYEYVLARNADESWYLTSAVDTASMSAPVPSGAAVVIIDRVRPAVSLYSIAPSLMALQNAAVIDTLHERMGSQPTHPKPDNAENDERLWVRLIGNDGAQKPKGPGIYGAEGARFDHHTYALQLGGDLQRHDDGAGKTTASGLYFTYAQSTDKVSHYDGRNAGKSTLDGTSVGAYWTRFYPKGSYIDLIGQVTSYRLRAQAPANESLHSNGKGFTLSAEGGHAFALHDHWALQPQLQLRVQRGALGNAHDGASRVRFDDLRSTVGRIGLRLAYKKENISLWVRADFLREFEGRSETTVANMAGLYGVTAYSSLQGNSVAMSVGAEAKLSTTMSIYASGRTEQRMGNRGRYSSLMLGAKWSF